MANISISNLSLAGVEQFSDNEIYMTDISDRDLEHVAGSGSAIPPDTIPPVTLTSEDFYVTILRE